MKENWYIFLLLLMLSLAAGCGEDTPLAPSDGPSADTTGSKVPFLIPLAPGASWRYAVYYEYIGFNLNDEMDEIRKHFVTLTLQVTAADTLDRSFSLASRFVVDSTALSAGLQPPGPDTTLHWQLITHNDTLWYDLEQGLTYCMPWDSAASTPYNTKIDLQLMDYPWENRFSCDFVRKTCGILPQEYTLYQTYCFNKYLSHGKNDSFLIRALGGLVEYNAFYAPVFHGSSQEKLQYRLLEYIPGSFGE